jgi:hypothetical protein
MKLSLLFLAVAIAARLGLFYAGVEIEGFTFGFVLMGLIVLLAFLSGNQLLRAEPNAPLPALFRVGLRSTAFFALVYALFTYGFFQLINTAEFPMRINGLVRDGVASGLTEQVARERLTAFFNPQKYALMTFFGLLSLGAVNALFFAGVHHKLLRKFRA